MEQKAVKKNVQVNKENCELTEVVDMVAVDKLVP